MARQAIWQLLSLQRCTQRVLEAKADPESFQKAFVTEVIENVLWEAQDMTLETTPKVLGGLSSFLKPFAPAGADAQLDRPTALAPASPAVMGGEGDMGEFDLFSDSESQCELAHVGKPTGTLYSSDMDFPKELRQDLASIWAILEQPFLSEAALRETVCACRHVLAMAKLTKGAQEEAKLTKGSLEEAAATSLKDQPSQSSQRGTRRLLQDFLAHPVGMAPLVCQSEGDTA